ncbi:hypothetical protein C0J52_12986 [Blattella germanica]|nr:hypothetical protein C0J52_12986 [Blattella germanica]
MKTSGRSTTMQCVHLLMCLVFGSKLLVAAAEIRAVNLPSDADKILEFLNNERQHNFEQISDDNNVQMAAIDLTESDSHPLRNVPRFLLHEERLRSQLDNKPLQSAQFVNKEEYGVSNQKLDVLGTVNLNDIVDKAIVDFRNDVLENGNDTIKIPDVHLTFKKKVGLVYMSGTFDGRKGWAKKISTIHRTSDVIASSDGNTLTIASGFGLTHCEAGFDKYVLAFNGLETSGKADATIAEDSLLLNITVSYSNHTCHTEINHLELNKFDGLTLRMTGLGLLDFLVPTASDIAFEQFKQDIKHKTEATLKKMILKKFKTFDCVKYIVKYLFN